ncbi:DUF4351 domain-containing protein [Clostridium sp. YIM B02505]|uniref:DUF4351 domain-containing protein n=1 Tax=Clostridium yunnanense TaxID=2800325 RepID=A0ABS1EUY6_9CLOT|nr:DUF4351 domain-containing protein [Clostridium yunnanense]MBK1813195.1 DUF4351 domain-containing protein [Clostridium yunnanense]
MGEKAKTSRRGFIKGFKYGFSKRMREGAANRLIEILKKQFGGIPTEYIEKINELPWETLKLITKEHLTLEALKDLERYF